MDQQPVGRGGVAPVRDHDGTPLGGLEDLRLDADLGQQLGHVLGGRPLPRPGVVAVVRGVDPDQVAADVDDLCLGW